MFVGKLSQRVPICPNMSHRVPNSSFCWRQASVDRQMSTGKCCSVRQQTVPTCPNMSHRVPNSSFCWRQANVDWQMSTGKCLSANCPNMSLSVPTVSQSPKLSQKVTSVTWSPQQEDQAPVDRLLEAGKNWVELCWHSVRGLVGYCSILHTMSQLSRVSSEVLV